jgi:hypothetical protein
MACHLTDAGELMKTPHWLQVRALDCRKLLSSMLVLAAGGCASAETPSDASLSKVGASAAATLAALAGGTAAINGKASFTATATGVDLKVSISGCVAPNSYPLFVAEGADCSSKTLAGPHWDGARGAGITPLSCTGASSGLGITAYSRVHSDEKPWSVGDRAASDVVGHALVVYDPSGSQAIACGPITRAADISVSGAAGSGAQAAGPPVAIRAQLAGLCLGKMIATNGAVDCPNPDELASCADEHCELSACVAQCADYLGCLQKSADPCSDMYTCALTDACQNCQSMVQSCALNFCADKLACAPPAAPNGPCSQLEACCAMQGDGAMSCQQQVRVIAQLGGDVSCKGVMGDWDFFSHLSVPCTFQ